MTAGCLTLKILTGNRAYCIAVSDDGNILQRAETGLEEEQFTLVNVELEFVGRYPFKDVNVASTN